MLDAQCGQAVRLSLGADSSCFYRLTPQLEHCGFQVFGVPSGLRSAYERSGLKKQDPFTPERLLRFGRPYMTPADLPTAYAGAGRALSSFLSSFGAGGTAEMLFRARGVPIAGLSLLWRDRRRMPASRDAAESLACLIETSLSHANATATQASCESLTVRERDVANAVCEGLSNPAIAKRLSIGVPTVKTHLEHIFAKTGARNRTQLATYLCASV